MTSKAHATSRKPEDDGDELHRLRDIVVEEVSLVDRAANKRRFLVVKRSGDMPEDEKLGAEVKPDGNGGLTATSVEKARKKPKDDGEPDEAEKARGRTAPKDGEDEDAERARRRAPADEDDDEEETEKAASRKKPSDEDEEEEAEKAQRRRGTTVGDEPEANEEFEEGIAEKADKLTIPKPVKEAMLRTLTEALERLMSVANRVKEAAETDEKLKTPVPTAIGREVGAIAELLEGVGESYPSPTSKVAKAGARMAKDRLDRFQKALALLSEVLKELTEIKAPKEPTAGAAEAGVHKRDTDAVPGLRELVAGIGELTRVVKRQEEELGRIRQARGLSNAIPVEGGRRAEPQEVSWPLDMNRPISRDSVAKAVSFYDE